jgi:predicted dehydrogenase
VSTVPASKSDALRKLLRFAGIYGPRRTFFKAAGRLRIRIPGLSWRRRRPQVAMIGCGQFAFATIAYFLQERFGRCFAACFDIDPRASASFGRAMRAQRVCATAEELLEQPEVRVVYIASNHASHTPHAVAALARGLDVYVEKPVAVTYEQLVQLGAAVRRSSGRIFAGYNRPFSAAIRELRKHVQVVPGEGISLQCFVSGHQIAAGHWYRDPDEGTRICGNVGHWLDLFVHLLNWRGLPDRLDISLTWADETSRDDDLVIAIASDRGDVFSVMLTSRSEPFEGINETLNFQHGNTIGKIDDFRRMTLWQGPRLLRRRYWPKDVGHRLAILQPFRQDDGRSWQEVLLSSLLTLHIAGMVRSAQRTSTFNISQSQAILMSEIEAR